MNIFRGRHEARTGLAVVEESRDSGATWVKLTPYRFWALHRSCEGFGWGYRGAGPHCLAGTLLIRSLDEGSEAYVLALFEDFALGFVYSWQPGGEWQITREEIRAWAIRQTKYIPTMGHALEDPEGFVKALTAKEVPLD